MASMAALVATMMVVLMVSGGTLVEGTLRYVGGSRTSWRTGVNFSQWAANQTFYVDDWLYFGFYKHSYSVYEVNRTSYENCIVSGFITNVTRGGRDVFHLLYARPYYFISGLGHCPEGVKVAFNVTYAPASAPVPVKHSGTSGLFPNFNAVGIVAVAWSSLLTIFL
ncbi:Early nodulin-like protein [Drosera capensis]